MEGRHIQRFVPGLQTFARRPGDLPGLQHPLAWGPRFVIFAMDLARHPDLLYQLDRRLEEVLIQTLQTDNDTVNGHEFDVAHCRPRGFQ